jgi:hypothetical protein
MDTTRVPENWLTRAGKKTAVPARETAAKSSAIRE